MKYIILLLALCACKQTHEAKKIQITPDGGSIETHYMPSRDIIDTTRYYVRESRNAKGTERAISDMEPIRLSWSVYNNNLELLWSVSLVKDTACIMATSADSLFKKCRVIKVAGKTYIEITK